MGILRTCPPAGLTEPHAISIATSAVEEFNRLKVCFQFYIHWGFIFIFIYYNFIVTLQSQGTKLEFSRVVRMTGVHMTGLLAYITLQCKDGGFYEAKAFKPMWDPFQLYIFRPAKHYPREL